jgi:methionyl-tRNA formyltransferase
MLTKEEGHLDFTADAWSVSCRTRGVDPWPGAFARLTSGEQAETVKLFAPRLADPRAVGVGRAGEVLCLDDHGLVVACGQGAVSFGELQLPGRRRLPAAAVMAGRGLELGTVLA